MNSRVRRSISEPIRSGLTWEDRWGDISKGLITAWEVGRGLSKTNKELVEKATRGELPVIGWKGGVDKRIKGTKYGVFYYFAEWQGLRGDDLDIDYSMELQMTCSKTGQIVIFTTDLEKYGSV